MDHAQGCITVFHAVHHDTHRKQIIDLIQCLVLIYHLFIDAEEMLDSSINLCLNARRLNMLAHLVYDSLDERLPDALSEGDLLHQIIVNLRFQIFQREVIQLHLDL